MVRALMVSPYLLLIIFSSKLYNAAFRRSEYYASKYIIASSIEAFKRQVEEPEYKDAIASTIFSELLIDPGEFIKMIGKRKEEQESIIKTLVSKMTEKVKDKIIGKEEATIDTDVAKNNKT